MPDTSRQTTEVDGDLERIEEALDLAAAALRPFGGATITAQLKEGGDPLTLADLAVDETLRNVLPRAGEGWLSEETVDDPRRLDCDRVWIVDPLDGTREFVAGIPEWCVSIGLVVDGRPVAGGILNPSSGQRVVGSVNEGVWLNGSRVTLTGRSNLSGALVLASRSEVKRGEWDAFFATPISVRNVGSVAYKLALVASGLADATWTLSPKNEWDVAGGAALVTAAGGEVFGIDFAPVEFNRADTLMPGFVAVAPDLGAATKEFLRRHLSPGDLS